MLSDHYGVSPLINFLIGSSKRRRLVDLHLKISGTTGHGSLLHKNTAGEKAQYLINKFMERRAQEVKKLENNPELTIGDVTTINLTRWSGGVQSNVVPPLLTVVFDVRLAITEDHDAFVEDVSAQLVHF